MNIVLETSGWRDKNLKHETEASNTHNSKLHIKRCLLIHILNKANLSLPQEVLIVSRSSAYFHFERSCFLLAVATR